MSGKKGFAKDFFKYLLSGWLSSKLAKTKLLGVRGMSSNDDFTTTTIYSRALRVCSNCPCVNKVSITLIRAIAGHTPPTDLVGSASLHQPSSLM